MEIAQKVFKIYPDISALKCFNPCDNGNGTLSPNLGRPARKADTHFDPFDDGNYIRINDFM